MTDHPAPRVYEGINPTVVNVADWILHKHSSDLRYLMDTNEWLVWNEGWNRDPDGRELHQLVTRTLEQLMEEDATLDDFLQAPSESVLIGRRRKVRRALGRFFTPSGVETIAKAAALQLSNPATSTDFDQDPYLVRALNGVIQLNTGDLLEAHRGHQLVRKLSVDYNPEAAASRWERFLKEVFVDEEVIDYVQMVVGYCLTADTRVQKMWLLEGSGSNGKSTFIRALQNIWGDLSQQTPETVLMGSGSSISNDIARLAGIRLAVLPESAQEQQLNETRVKALVSGDTISARMMYKEYQDIQPIAKYFLMTNHLPVVRGRDDGIWRRLVVVPFRQRFEVGLDSTLEEDLLAEREGILAWAVQGAVKYSRRPGVISEPETVCQATLAYQTDQDSTGQFVNDALVKGSDYYVGAQQLADVYSSWCKEHEVDPLSSRALGGELKKRGFRRVRKGRERRWAWQGACIRTAGGNP